MTSPLVLAVDGNSLVHRSYHSQAHTGVPTWAVRGLLTQLLAAVERIRPAAVVVGFDDPDSSLRRERWPQYKAHRGEKLDTLVEQLALAIEVAARARDERCRARRPGGRRRAGLVRRARPARGGARPSSSPPTATRSR